MRSCRANMKFVDITALKDSIVTFDGSQHFGNTELFAAKSSQKEYATLEHNQFILDGTQEILPEAPKDIAFWTNEKSNEECRFKNASAVNVQFSKPHSSAGITLYFEKTYPTTIQVTWYTLTENILSKKIFYPDSNIYFCKNLMENYGKIKIEFLETQFPDTYVRMQYVLYGIELNWDEEVIRKAKMTEESDYTMATLPQNTACIEIVDEKNDFDIGNNEGSWKAVQNNQEVVITAEIDGEKYPCGTFYISKFSFKGNVATFNLTDLIGTLDGKIFYDGMFYKSIKAGKLLEQIFAAAGCTKYKIAEDVYVTEVSGYLGVQSCRECIKAICFACGAIADDVRKDTIEIYYPDRYVQYTVGPERKVFGGTSVRLENYVSGVSIECSQYIISDQSMQLYNGTLGAGVTRITFTMPCDQESLEVIGGEVVKKSVNYVDVYMVEKGECTVNGIIYSERNFTYEKKVNMLPSGVNENIKKFGKCTLYNSEKLPEIAERLLDYYSLQKMLETQYFTECECVGKWMSIGNIAGEFAYTLLEKQTIDMTGGFLASATCRGYSRVVTELHFAGDDIYAGGNILI